MTRDLLGAANRVAGDMVDLRRAIHREPELGLQNPLTARKVREALAALPLTFREGGSTSGFVARIDGAKPGPVVLLRADMDALPIHERTGLDYASTIDGVMHACGHDAHAAMLVGAAHLLWERRDAMQGSVLLMFQPGEEGYHGARHMLDDGLIDPLPDAAFALHIAPDVPLGLVRGRQGPLLASADHVTITVTGRGAHASTPHRGRDPVPAACSIAIHLQTLVTRRLDVFDGAVVTVGQIHAGTAYNIVAEEAVLDVSVRALSAETRSTVEAEIRRLVAGIAAAHGVEARVDYRDGFPATICDARAAEHGRRTVERLFGAEGWSTLPQPYMNSEDFSYVLEKVPGAMFMIGAGQGGDVSAACCALHSGDLMFDEAVLPRGAALHAALALDYLAERFNPPADERAEPPAH
ncbi:hippurate hydrolase [Sphingopyxis sp. OAS728]|uniref:M20 metallopeptidase family protein n=1 Tax=Sphingopyxis sp. OAS728 TaxID=2663823 RepID=UPI0019FDEA90|nr:M20 family metallopeptidase [Sphingopyxis sp. OAS728]MBE1527992.1 hippurate hydrolase [Sphingopyxis sp. OAS728]